ncbi:hypothetical protein P7K49_008388 [Saguinus oedipus]|uniref:Uncharacterized protein n=1 Tax=Saguinus oedipus TaxID=9490 RepID=A0ABQ9VXL9_SAGOE|nr:hypothetical protein P7K49_008388 [Saguinus oedipus]
MDTDGSVQHPVPMPAASAESLSSPNFTTLAAVKVAMQEESPGQADDLSNSLGQMSLSCQDSTEATDSSAALFQPPLISQHRGLASWVSPSPPLTIPPLAMYHLLSKCGYPGATCSPLNGSMFVTNPPGQYPNPNQPY